MALRNRAYDFGELKTHRVSVPVVSLGNLTTGGTGKTPIAAELANQLLQAGLKPAIVSRGYRADASGKNDEARVLEILVPQAIQILNRDRVAGAEQAIDAGANVILLDDGYQHRRLHRDFNLLLIDALNPFGYGRLLPRGLLRESLVGARRADLVLLTRADLVTSEQLSEINAQLKQIGCVVPVVQLAFEATQLVSHSGTCSPLSQLSERKVQSFCGIGNPEGFRKTLVRYSGEWADECLLEFPDHHHYSQSDLSEIARGAKENGAEFLVTTLKDLVKIQRDDINGMRLYALRTGLRILGGEREWNDLIRSMIAAAQSRDTGEGSVPTSC